MIFKIIKRFNAKIRKIKRKIIWYSHLLQSQKNLIINSAHDGDSIVLLKDKSIERVYFSKIYNLATTNYADFYYPKIEIRKYSDAQIYSASDFILTEEGAIWDKYYKPQWVKTTPLDNDFLKIKDEHIFIKRAKNYRTIDCAFSLCGVHSTIWAHFLVQYLPKIFFLKQILLIENHDVTIVLPLYKDSQIQEFIFMYLAQLKISNIIVLKPNEVANCKVLYHIENTSYLSDHANYLNPADIIIPHLTLDTLRNNFVNHLIKVNRNHGYSEVSFRKIYLGRTGRRNVINNEEIEKYFISQGFEMVYPHKLSLDEKVNLFREAAIIAGPYSSGFTNIIFCKEGTKALGFINFQRTFDGYGSTFANYFGVDLMLVTGNDIDDSIHSSYSIPLPIIKSAYFELLSSGER